MNYTGYLWSECQSPLTHMRGVEGNEALIAREAVDTPSGKRWVPCLSANALRHRCVREPGGLWLVERLGLKGKLSLLQLNFLLHGGNLTGSTGREDTNRIAEMQELFPLLRLLGGSLPDQILRGSLQMWRGQLVCEENRPYLMLPEGFALPALRPAEHYVEGYQYTRGDAADRPEWRGVSPVGESRSNRMIFSGQAVIKGAVFLHGFVIPHGSELEFGCLMHALALWQAEGGTVGGMASKGHGILATSILDGADASAVIAAYEAHVDDKAQACRDWLEKVFRAKPEKAKKGRKEEADG